MDQGLAELGEGRASLGHPSYQPVTQGFLNSPGELEGVNDLLITFLRVFHLSRGWEHQLRDKDLEALQTLCW